MRTLDHDAPEHAEPDRGTLDRLEERFAEALASGKTVALSSRELDDPQIRRQLPDLLDAAAQRTSNAGDTELPGYCLLAEVGHGGMSTVYLARQEKLDRHVAVKIAPKWLGAESRAQRVLAKEARVLARLEHPNIVEIYDVIDDGEVAAIAMEWVDGCTLKALLAALPAHAGEDDLARIRETLGEPEPHGDRFRETSVRFFAGLVRDVARAAHAAHEAGVLHLDIKPGNVLVRRDGTPLLADFGGTRDLETEQERTQALTMVGTPVYASPEQLRRRDRDIARPSDVYSLGLTLYEAVARTQPLRGLDLAGIVQCVEAGRMPRLSTLAAVPPDLENVVHKAIAPEPERRYQTAAALAEDLHAFLEHRSVSARPLGPSERLRRWARNEPWKAALAATLAVLIPALASLTTYLLQQLPAIAREDDRQRLSVANQIKQEALQRYLTKEIGVDAAIEMLEVARGLDPGDTTTACLVALANEAGWWRARDELASTGPASIELADRTEPLHRALALQRAEAQRSFHTADERRQLRESDSVADHYALALDRVFAAEDQPSEHTAREALRALEETAQRVPPDPLLLGLCAWFAARCDAGQGYESAARVLRDVWPSDPGVRAWASLAIEPFDTARALRLAEAIRADMPQIPRGHELVVANRLRAGALDEALAAADAAAAAGVDSRSLQQLRLRVLAAQRQPDAVAALVQSALDDELSVARQLKVLAEHRPEALDAHVRQLLAPERAAPHVLEELYLMAREDVALADEIWPRYASSFADRRRLHERRMVYLYRDRDMAAVAALGRDLHLQRGWADKMGARIATAFVQERDWPELQRIAREWVELGDETARASFFLGLAHARLGEPEAAVPHLDRAIGSSAAGKTWYACALLESAHQRVAADAPEGLRNPAGARALLQRFDEARTRGNARGPWTALVRALVHDANGEREQARAHVEAGLRARRRESEAPEDVTAQLQALAARLR